MLIFVAMWWSSIDKLMCTSTLVSETRTLRGIIMYV